MSDAPLVHELVPPPDPVESCARFAGLPYRVFLDSARDPERLGRYSFLTADPTVVVRSRGARAEALRLAEGTVHTITGHALDAVRALLAPHRCEPIPGVPPFQSGAAGYIGYDWGSVLERLPAPRYDDLAIPDVHLGLYDWVIAWDHMQRRAWIISTGLPASGDERRRRGAERLAMVTARLSAPPPAEHATQAPAPSAMTMISDARTAARAPAYPVHSADVPPGVELRSSFTHRGYLDAVSRVREYILAGDIFEANISQRLEAPLTEPPWSLYRRLRALNPAPFAAFLELDDAHVLSASPERFLRLTPDGHVEARPIKGTRPRGVSPEHDEALGRALADSVKDRAENLMIVDLLRNDLSRVCVPGTVRAPEIFALEHYATVHHLVSTVVGELAPGMDAVDLVCAAFPGGSITGAPKIRAMEIIAELEPSRRGVYCGAIGYLSVTGALDTSIVIRTYLALGGRVYFSVGGAITADSDPEQEYQETMDKARALISGLGTRDSGLATASAAETSTPRAGRVPSPESRPLMIFLLDNYDSFVHNLARYVRELGAEPVVRRNDAVTLEEIEVMAPSHIIISPGPCSPAEAGISVDVVRRFVGRVPILGVCLGHQAIGAAYGGEIVRARQPMHGKTSRMHHEGTGIFAGVPSPFLATRYHSLVIAPASLPPVLRVTATAEDGEIMAVAHREARVVGVQFHPESALTEHGYWLLDRFLDPTRVRDEPLANRADLARAPVTDDRFVPPPVELVR